MTAITLVKGLNMGLRKALENDQKVVIMGEDVGKHGGVFRVTDGLQKDFGEDLVIDTPRGVAGIVGTALGLAPRAGRPACRGSWARSAPSPPRRPSPASWTPPSASRFAATAPPARSSSTASS